MFYIGSTFCQIQYILTYLQQEFCRDLVLKHKILFQTRIIQTMNQETSFLPQQRKLDKVSIKLYVICSIMLANVDSELKPRHTCILLIPTIYQYFSPSIFKRWCKKEIFSTPS